MNYFVHRMHKGYKRNMRVFFFFIWKVLMHNVCGACVCVRGLCACVHICRCKGSSQKFTEACETKNVRFGGRGSRPFSQSKLQKKKKMSCT